MALPAGTVRITATVGIATFLEDHLAQSPEDLLRLADSRLYMGKRAGRDRVVWRDCRPRPDRRHERPHRHYNRLSPPATAVRLL